MRILSLNLLRHGAGLSKRCQTYHRGVLLGVIFLGLVFLVSAIADPVHGAKEAVSFEATTLDGKVIRSEDLKGKKSVFLVFWTTWCPVCLKEVPRLKKVYSEYSPKGMAFLAINPGVNDSIKKTKKYLKKHDISYPVVFDKERKITNSMGVRGVPTVIILDKAGVEKYRDAKVPDDLAAHFAELMK